MRKDLTLIGAATDLGQGKKGTELAPSWLRLHGLRETLTKKFFNLKDLGDFNPYRESNKSGQDYELINSYNYLLMQNILEELESNRTVLTMGGDHSVAIGTLSASLKHRPNTKVVWVDAHADINTPETSPSGNVHGMPLALFFKLKGLGAMKEVFSWVPDLDPKNLVYIGLRDVDHGERQFLKDLGITAYDAHHVHEQGIDTILDQTMDQLCPRGDENLHLSFDVDGLDPSFVPATGTPVDGGIHLMDGQKIVNTLAGTGRLSTFDVVEVNPMLGKTHQELELTKASTLALLDALPVWNEIDLPLSEIILRNSLESSFSS
jgi:arginase